MMVSTAQIRREVRKRITDTVWVTKKFPFFVNLKTLFYRCTNTHCVENSTVRLNGKLNGVN